MRLGDKLKGNFAKNLKALREQQQLSRAELADALNDRYKSSGIDIQRTSIVNYESENALPRTDALYCIAHYFGKTIDQMLGEYPLQPLPAEKVFTKNVALAAESPLADSLAATDRSDDEMDDLNGILRGYVDAIGHRRFYLEYVSRLMQEMKADAPTDEARMQIEHRFSKTFLGCLIGKSKFFQDMAVACLDDQEYKVFMAFQERSASISMVAAALEITEEAVIAIFNSAKTKIADHISPSPIIK